MGQQTPVDTSALEYLKSGAKNFVIGSVLLFISVILLVFLPLTGFLFIFISSIITWISLIGFERWYSRTEKGFKVLSGLGFSVGLGNLGVILTEIGLYIWIFLGGVSIYYSSPSLAALSTGIPIYRYLSFFYTLELFSIGGLIIAAIGSLFVAMTYSKLGNSFRSSLINIGGWIAFSALAFNLIYHLAIYYISRSLVNSTPSIALIRLLNTLDILRFALLIVPFALIYLGLRKAETLGALGYGRTYMVQPSAYPQVTYQQGPPPYPLPIYQVGPDAVINPDGTVTFQVYSTQLAQIIGAVIEGTNFTATSVTPNVVNPNQVATVTLNFGPIRLTPGAKYKIVVTAIINNSPVQFPVFAKV